MHPSDAALIAFCDAETGPAEGQRISRHLEKCEQCREQLGRIERERGELSARATVPAMENRHDLAVVLSAMTAWQEGRNGAAESELRERLRWQIETYFGSHAALTVEGRAVAAEEMLGKASEMFEVFLGPEAAEAVRNDVFRGLDWAEPAGELCR